MQRAVITLIQAVACAAFLLGVAPQVQAADATGTWTWTTQGRQGGEGRKVTLTLKAEGEKLTGKMATPARGGEMRETEISAGKVKGDDISFTITREFGGNSISQKYSGKLSGDTIKGKIESERNGETQSRDWEAKREPAKKS
jgi:hypothetical protein